MHRPAAHTRSTLRENRRTYDQLVQITRAHAAAGDAERVLQSAMWAANYGWLAPTGRVGDIALERLVVHAVRGDGEVVVDGGRRSGRILHVVSEAYPTGGHTRLVSRWAARDHRRSDLALTNQSAPPPSWLVETITSSGGAVHDLAAAAVELLPRAVALRALIDEADVVVLHTHPYDVVALAAVNLPGTRPPVVLENHADHTYWLGVAAADLVCELRPESRTLDVPFRGVQVERTALLPMPLEPRPAVADDQLRGRLGIGRDAVVAVTVTDSWKVTADWGRGLHDVVDRLLRWCPELVVVLVGADPTPGWTKMASRYPGRAVAVGKVPDAGPFYAMADLYLDSYPIRSGTTPLEAAMAGLPVAALADLPPGDPAAILQAGSPGLADQPVSATLEQLVSTVRRLVADPVFRAARGAAARAGVEGSHSGPRWAAALEELYGRARASSAVDVDQLVEPPDAERLSLMFMSVWSLTGPGSPAAPVLAGPLRSLFGPGRWGDLLAVTSSPPHLTFRAAAGWERSPDDARQLLSLAAATPHLTVSLPFVSGDAPDGARTGAVLVGLLADVGLDTENCGDVQVDARDPDEGAVAGPLRLDSASTAWLAGVLRSPLWPSAALVG